MISKPNKMIPLFVLSSFALSGCTNTKTLSNNDIDKLDSYVSTVAGNEVVDTDELNQKIAQTIPQIKDKDNASTIINKYIYILYNEARNYLPYFDIIGKDIVEIKNKLNLDNIDVSMYKEISKESKVIGAIFEEMYNFNLMVIDENNSFFTEVNVQKILDEYGPYLNESLIEFLKFRASENITPVFDANTDEYNLDVLIERANTCATKALEKSNSEQLENWKSSASYYYEILLAENTEQFLEDGLVKTEYIKEIESILKKYNGQQIDKDLTGYIELLKSNNYDINNEEVAEYRTMLFNQMLDSNQKE